METQEIHSTRLKEKLIEAIPGLTAHTKGREVLLAFDEDMGMLISDVSSGDNDANAMCLERAASIVRKDMFSESYIANGTFSQNGKKESIPQSLLSSRLGSQVKLH